MKKVMRRNILLTVLAFLLCLSVGLSAGFATVFAETTPKTLAEVTLTMEDGALIRGSEPTGIRFRSFMSEADYEGLMANVGEGKAYKSVNFGMLIAPEDYLTTGRELTEANVFGENAIYSYGDTAEEGKTRIINVWDSEMYDYTDGKFFAGIITNVAGTNYNRVFAGQAYVKATAQDGTASYLFAAATDNHRSVIGVAQAAIANGDTSEAVQSFVKNADLVGLVGSVENGDKTAANAVDYKEGVISANAGTNGNLYIRLNHEVISEKGAGCEYLRLYIKSSTLASFGIIPRNSAGSEDWGYFRTMLTTTGYRDSDNNSCAYKDIPLNDASVHDFSKYDLTLWAAGANQNITVDKVEYISQEKEIIGSFLSSSSWTVAGTEAENSITIACKNVSISSEWIKAALSAGYTHLKFDYSMTGEGAAQVALTHSETWNRFWRQLGTSDTMRIDLNEFNDDDTYYSFNLANRNSSAAEIDGVITISNPVLYKSEETASWTKSNTGIYCAEEEDGFIVLDTRQAGNDANVLSSEAFCAKYFNNTKGKEVSQNTVMLMGRYLVAGSNTRGMVWGDTSAAINVVGTTANTDFVIEYLNNRNDYAAGNKFYMGLDKEGVYQLKVIDYVSSRNSWGGFSFTYVDENTFTATMADGQKLVYVNTQEMIAAGYTKVVITAGEYTSGQLWVGNDSWSGDTAYMHGLNGGASIELDLSKFTTDNPWLVIYSSGATTATVQVRFF